MNNSFHKLIMFLSSISRFMCMKISDLTNDVSIQHGACVALTIKRITRVNKKERVRCAQIAY